jgi:hypothetical protein
VPHLFEAAYSTYGDGEVLFTTTELEKVLVSGEVFI